MSVPSRKQRNQPSTHVHSLEFATDITTSLMAQYRQLQAVLVEKDEDLKQTMLEKSRLELEAQGFAQRLKSLDENEQRYKDENWSLETQTHELIAASKEAASREQRLQQALAVTASEKSAAQRDLDEIRQAHGKLSEDHALFRKTHDSELAGLRKNLAHGDTEKDSMQKKIEELTSQNQELVKAMSGRFRSGDQAVIPELGPEPEDFSLDKSDFEHSPPPSPSKGAVRNSALESETLKSSLHHAHRMIQTLKGNLNREKSEKSELKRMLQESRDEIDARRHDTTGPNGAKRTKLKSQHENQRKAKPGQLGAGRGPQTEVEMQEPEWEDNVDEPSLSNAASRRAAVGAPRRSIYESTDASDAYQTANDTDDAFETANERDTGSEAFQTGNEEMAGDSSDDLTETEDGPSRKQVTSGSRFSSQPSNQPGSRSSFISTASTSGSDEEPESRTPVQSYPQKYKLKIGRGKRSSRVGSEGPPDSNLSSSQNSPASFVADSSQKGQSLFAELGDFDEDDNEEEIDGTPRRRSLSAQQSRRSSRSSTPKRDIVQSIEHEPPVPQLPQTLPNAAIGPTLNQGFQSSLPSTPIQTRDIGVQRTPMANSRPVDSSTSTTDSPRPAWDQPLGVIYGGLPTFTTSPVPSAYQSTPPRATPAPKAVSKLSFSQVQSLETEPVAHHADSPIARPSSVLHSSATSVPPQSAPLDFSEVQHLDSAPVQPSANTGFLSGWTRGIMGSAPPNASETEAGMTDVVKDSRNQRPTTAIYNDVPKGLPRDSVAIPEAEESETLAGTSPEAVTQNTEHHETADTSTTKNVAEAGIIGSVLGMVGLKKASPKPQAAEDDVENIDQSTHVVPRQGVVPLKEVSGNTTNRESVVTKNVSKPMNMTDHGAQTILSSEQIDGLLNRSEKKTVPLANSSATRTPSLKPLSDIGSPLVDRTERSPVRNSKDISGRAVRRPSSSGSMKASTNYTALPPLPADHQQAIATAAQRQQQEQLRTPTKPRVDTSMGPPLMSASAYKAMTQRNSQSVATDQPVAPSPSSRASATPRARFSSARSRTSRRSSRTSFESELDARFNIPSDPNNPYMAFNSDGSGSTDPRMIQAITQTMIGEYLWKYTRKAGRGEMSNNRHRRFFWVHPYTRTLYWSDTDPAAAGRAQLKAKSVAIEAVRVMADDNPMPPGLHRKSLVIMTPGREVKFTAGTGQRHETWFNALSYLLLRSTGGADQGPDGTGYTAEDVAEFDPNSFRGNRAPSSVSRLPSDRISLSSYNSRPVTVRSSRASSRPAEAARLPPGVEAVGDDASPSRASTIRRTARSTSRESATRRVAYPAADRSSQQIQQGSFSSRLSSYWKPKDRGSLSSRFSNARASGADGTGGSTGSIYNASVVEREDSAEDLRQVLEKQERESDTLENVRACCDGKFTQSGMLETSITKADMVPSRQA